MRRPIFALAALAGVFLQGCGGGSQEVVTQARPVRITWHGNQCFTFTSSIGTSILTNPFEGGGLPSPLKPDILLISQERPEANNINAADNQPTIFRGSVAMGVNNASGIRIRGIATFPNPDRETVDGMNIVYTWTMDGIRFCHLGWLANPLTPYQLSQLGPVDVLIVPVGGPLSPEDRQTVLAQVRPRVVIPAGRGAGGWTAGGVRSVGGKTLVLSREQVPLQLTTFLFGG